MEGYTGCISKSSGKPDGYDDPETNGYVIPLNSPVLKQRQKEPSPGKFAKMERFFFDKMTPTEFKTFATMLMLGLYRGGCHVITNEDIKKWSGLSKRTIERAQAGLKRKGFLKRHNTPVKCGSLWQAFTKTEDVLEHCKDHRLLFPENGKFVASK